MTDWLRVLPRIELSCIDEVTLPPLARLVRLDGAILSGTALSGFPRRVLRDVSGGGDGARSLIGDTLRELGRSGDDLRAFFAARPDKDFHFVSLDGEGAADSDSLFEAIGVESSFAISNGLNDAPVRLEMAGIAGLPCGMSDAP